MSQEEKIKIKLSCIDLAKSTFQGSQVELIQFAKELYEWVIQD